MIQPPSEGPLSKSVAAAYAATDDNCDATGHVPAICGFIGFGEHEPDPQILELILEAIADGCAYNADSYLIGIPSNHLVATYSSPMAFLKLNDRQQQRLAAIADRQLFDKRVTESLKHRMRETTMDTPTDELQRIMHETIEQVLDELDPPGESGSESPPNEQE